MLLLLLLLLLLLIAGYANVALARAYTINNIVAHLSNNSARRLTYVSAPLAAILNKLINLHYRRFSSLIYAYIFVHIYKRFLKKRLLTAFFWRFAVFSFAAKFLELRGALGANTNLFAHPIFYMFVSFVVLVKHKSSVPTSSKLPFEHECSY